MKEDFKKSGAFSIDFAPMVEAIVEMVTERMKEEIANSIKDKEPRYYSRKEAAEILKVTLQTLYNMTKNGMITAKKIGRKVIYDADALDEAVKEQRVYKYKRYRKEAGL